MKVLGSYHIPVSNTPMFAYAFTKCFLLHRLLRGMHLPEVEHCSILFPLIWGRSCSYSLPDIMIFPAVRPHVEPGLQPAGASSLGSLVSFGTHETATEKDKIVFFLFFSNYRVILPPPPVDDKALRHPRASITSLHEPCTGECMGPPHMRRQTGSLDEKMFLPIFLEPIRLPKEGSTSYPLWWVTHDCCTWQEYSYTVQELCALWVSGNMWRNTKNIEKEIYWYQLCIFRVRQWHGSRESGSGAMTNLYWIY